MKLADVQLYKVKITTVCHRGGKHLDSAEEKPCGSTKIHVEKYCCCEILSGLSAIDATLCLCSVRLQIMLDLPDAPTDKPATCVDSAEAGTAGK